MDKLNNEEIARIFTLYPDVECIHPRFPDSPVSYNNTMDNWFSRSNYGGAAKDFWDNRMIGLTKVEDIRPEDVIEVAKILKYPYPEDNLKDEIIQVLLTDYSVSDFSGPYPDIYALDLYYCYEYLKTKFYAVPLYFGPGHWANGKNAIELRIAYIL